MKGKHFSINPHIQCSMKNVPKIIAHKLNVETIISKGIIVEQKISWSKRISEQKKKMSIDNHSMYTSPHTVGPNVLFLSNPSKNSYQRFKRNPISNRSRHRRENTRTHTHTHKQATSDQWNEGTRASYPVLIKPGKSNRWWKAAFIWKKRYKKK